ncbi:MAG: glycosyltransferase [Planctomycetaceae bacterium]
MSTLSPPRICFVAPNALPVIDSNIPGPIGGIETRSWLFARTMARCCPSPISFVVRDAVAPQHSTISGVRIVPLVEPLTAVRRAIASNVVRRPQFPWLSIRRWSPNLLWQLPVLALAKLSPFPHGLSGGVDTFLQSFETDVFCTFGVNPASASAVATAHAQGVPAALVLGSDGDLDPGFLEGGSYANQYGDRGDMSLKLLQSANLIVVQTTLQQRLLKERFGRESELVANPIEVDAWTNPALPSTSLILPDKPFALWIGRADHTPKQPAKVLEIARALPDMQFLMVMNPFDSEVEEAIRQTKPPNVTIVSRVAPVDMPAVFSRATALLNTSSFEGFPNTFLQAALAEVPIVSLSVKPESTVALPFGTCADGELGAAIEALRQISQSGANPQQLRELRTAVEESHAADQQAHTLHRLLCELVGKRN